MAVVRKFVFGKDVIPKWFDEQATKGRVKVNREDGVLVSAKVYTPTKTLEVKVGDIVVLSKNGLSVLPGDQAEGKEERKSKETVQQAMDD